MRREIGRIECEDDQGRPYTVVEYQNYRVWKGMDGVAQEVPTTRAMTLRNGEPVNFVDDDTFEIVRTDTIIRRV